MPLDVERALAPDVGIATSFQVVPPAGIQVPLWSVVVDIGFRHGDGSSLTDLVGACGTNPQDTALRAAGEAIERFAIRRLVDCTRASFDELSGQALPFWEPDIALGDPGAMDRKLAWTQARALTSEETIWVPYELVCYPGSNDAKWFDATPSGAAAGGSLDRAMAAALLEIVERDAVQVAWARQLRLELLDLSTSPGSSPAATELAALVRILQRGRFPFLAARIGTGIPGVACVIACILEESSPGRPRIAACGAKASFDETAALSGALREALQVRSLILSDHARHGEPEPIRPSDVVTNADRLRFWRGTEAFDALQQWTKGFRAPVAIEPAQGTTTLQKAIVSIESAGSRVWFVDLSGCVPDAVQQMNVAVVKAIVPGYQAMRLREDVDFSWNAQRLSSAEERSGCEAMERDVTKVPHPLI